MSLTLEFIVAGLVSGSIYAIAAMGLVLSYRTSGVLNFAHGAIAAIAAGLFYELHIHDGLPWGLAAFISLVVTGSVLGLIMERTAFVLAGASTVMRVVATIGIAISLTAIFELRWGYGNVTVPQYLPSGKAFSLAGVNIDYSEVIVVAVGVTAAIGLSLLLRQTPFGRHCKAVVDDPVLFDLSGRSAVVIRRWSWLIGCLFAALSGILIIPNLGLNATALTLLVIESFGAASIGRFASLPLAYLGALIIGIGASIATQYATSRPFLTGLPTSLPFLVLFVVLLCIRRRNLVEIGTRFGNRAAVTYESEGIGRFVKLPLAIAVLCVVPVFAGSLLSEWTLGIAYMVILLSLSLLVRTSNQISLCQMGFAAVGAAAFSKLLTAGVPWLLALLFAGLIVVPIGVLLAVPAIRLQGVYLAVATLGFGIFLEQQIYNTSWMFGGAGLSLFTPRPSFASGAKPYYYLVLVVLIVIYGFVRWIEHGQLGRLLRARADSAVALSCLGASTRAPAVVVFSISAFIAGIAGALIGPIFEVVGGDNFQTIPTSIMLVALLVLAARNTKVGTFGVAAGAAVGLVILPAYISNGNLQQWLTLLFGVAALEAAAASTGRAPTRLLLDRLRAFRRTGGRASGETNSTTVSPAETEPAHTAPGLCDIRRDAS